MSSHEDPPEKDPESYILSTRASLELATSSSVGHESKSISVTGVRFKENGDQGVVKEKISRGGGGFSVGQVLAVWARGPEFIPLCASRVWSHILVISMLGR